MNIKKIFIKNITVFEDFELNFDKGVNVIIGENGTGKTHLLKYIYALTQFIDKKDDTKIEIAKEFFNTEPFNLVKNNQENAEIEIIYSEDQKLTYKIIKDIESKKYNENISFNDYINLKTLFIPAKDMISHSKGFLALNNKFNLPFDKTYIDIITNAELPEAKQISKVHQNILDKLSKVIGGTVVYENDNFYIIKKDNKKIEFSLEAEGFRKLGLLYKLIRNGLIDKDTILLWDEPESNINPELIP
ncbi:MAG: AAA family ATPase, partial [Intestinibacter sp.]|uniref:AAA family ATPase n=1 Tax=Intestinibacter sp. TaxID=1965304 RepID=UPI0025BF19CC